ncbi:DUF4190 domain-containing protein [Kitasatospora albolonga]
MARPPLSGLAVASLVLSLLIFLAPVGLILGVIALVRIPRTGRRGKGLAIAGTAVGGAVVALSLLLVAFGGARFSAWTTDGSGSAKAGTLRELREGDCFTPKGSRGEEEPWITDPSVEIVPCGKPHQGEVFATFRLKGNHAISDSEKISEQAAKGCAPLLHDFALDPTALPTVLPSSYYPVSVSWTGEDRTVQCWMNAEDSRPERSLRQDPSQWNRHQLAYLKAMRPLSEARVTAPDTPTEDNLAASTAWAGRMARGGAESARLLRAAVDGFPAEVQGPVTGLANQLDALSPERRSAAEARTPAEFDKRWESVAEEDWTWEEWEARSALGLSVEGEGEEESGEEGEESSAG